MDAFLLQANEISLDAGLCEVLAIHDAKNCWSATVSVRA